MRSQITLKLTFKSKELDLSYYRYLEGSVTLLVTVLIFAKYSGWAQLILSISILYRYHQVPRYHFSSEYPLQAYNLITIFR